MINSLPVVCNKTASIIMALLFSSGGTLARPNGVMILDGNVFLCKWTDRPHTMAAHNIVIYILCEKGTKSYPAFCFIGINFLHTNVNCVRTVCVVVDALGLFLQNCVWLFRLFRLFRPLKLMRINMLLL